VDWKQTNWFSIVRARTFFFAMNLRFWYYILLTFRYGYVPLPLKSNLDSSNCSLYEIGTDSFCKVSAIPNWAQWCWFTNVFCGDFGVPTLF
jgi:hypothetical protein